MSLRDARSALQRTRLRLPIRLKLAMVSAGLTFVILLLFAVVVGAFTAQKLHDGFDNELRATAADLQDRIQVRTDENGDVHVVPPDSLPAAAAGGAAIRILNANGDVVFPVGAPRLATPVEGVSKVGGYRVVSRPLLSTTLPRANPFELQPPVGGPVGWLQYGKSEHSVDATVARVRFFLGMGVLGGTLLALLAGAAVARRAMRPIAGLTQAAREVARTRNPAVTLPKPEAGDEVADLAHTLEDMLSELGAARAETEAALARQREFVADASHELRTPLTSILANLELLEAELAARGETDGAAEVAGAALRSSRRMRRLVADLLLLARADAGRRSPHRPVDLGEVAREAVAEASALTVDHEVELGGRSGDAVVEGVPDDLHRLALNLVENALIHTPPGTTVRVATRREDGTAVLEVTDDGPGVPAEMRQRVFERFARGDGDAAPTARGGSGLGLAIVRAVAEAHGGSVALSQPEGGGARVLVRLPAASRPRQGATQQPATGNRQPA
ncbi:MAG TPA: HAMP domain-containing sensor histidine kinase [Thermoleophilaceae bacterium]|nr:HAMP domain-containing sensor histidine kinase [Thermoleophilaceae bacterium]